MLITRRYSRPSCITSSVRTHHPEPGLVRIVNKSDSFEDLRKFRLLADFFRLVLADYLWHCIDLGGGE